MTNPTPEKLKHWEEAAKERYPEYPDHFPHGNETIKETKEAYLQGRQDEWREQNKEVQFRMKLLKEHFFNVRRLAMPDENLTDEILESWWNVYCIEKEI